MKRLIFTLCTLLVLTFTFTWLVFPQTMSQFLLTLNNVSAGLTAKSVETPLGAIHYLEGGVDAEGSETVVLLHGIFARKEHWVDLARELTPHFRVIALDLPGFGDNFQLHTSQYSLDNQARNLTSVLDALNIKRAHIGANSMGAQVAGLIATQQPALFKSLAFIGSPLGVSGKLKSDMDHAIENGLFPLVAQSETQFMERNTWLFPETPFIPEPILRSWMQQEINTPQKNKGIWYAANDFNNTPKLLELAPALLMPTLIIWCEEDRIFHVSGADSLHQALPDSQRETLSGCGHVPMLDAPEKVADLYHAFIINQSS